jgi:membrane protease YdiL (CAAX protease family)
LLIFLVATFAISWGCWWTLATALSSGGSVFSSGLFRSLYLVGGFGPTIAGFVAVAVTPADGSLGEYGARLVRWRVNPIWWLAAFLTPVVFALGKEWIAVQAGRAELVHVGEIEPLARFAMLFPTMVIGGGLEELGWRGVAQPLVERRAPRLAAALLVGGVWALWHLPLFHIPGVSQSGRNFPLFAADVLGNAVLLAWIYGQTRSILLCVIFHAMGNTATAMGLAAVGPPTGVGAWTAVVVKLVVAVAFLLFVTPRPASAQTASG